MNANVASRLPIKSLDWLRWMLPVVVGFVIVIILFWLMSRMVRPQIAGDGEKLIEVFEQIELVEVQPEQQPQGAQTQQSLDAPPPPPPPAPMMSQPDLPGIAVPAMVAAPMDSSSLQLSTALTGVGTGLKLGSIGGFGGFAGKGGGGGGGGSGAGYGTGQGFTGKPLVPLSTARPQMPDWACKQKIRGWVEVVFIVLPTGRVTNVRLVDADPRGVFEGAAIESITNWIYPSSNNAREVKQRVPMDPEDCAYNWQ